VSAGKHSLNSTEPFAHDRFAVRSITSVTTSALSLPGISPTRTRKKILSGSNRCDYQSEASNRQAIGPRQIPRLLRSFPAKHFLRTVGHKTTAPFRSTAQDNNRNGSRLSLQRIAAHDPRITLTRSAQISAMALSPASRQTRGFEERRREPHSVLVEA